MKCYSVSFFWQTAHQNGNGQFLVTMPEKPTESEMETTLRSMSEYMATCGHYGASIVIINRIELSK